MKALVSSMVLVLLSLSAQAKMSDLTGAKVADLMVNSTVRKCVADLVSQTKGYELRATDAKAGEITGSGEKKSRITQITYDLIEGGDMMMGTATLNIEEKFASQFGFPESGNMEYVSSCTPSQIIH